MKDRRKNFHKSYELFRKTNFSVWFNCFSDIFLLRMYGPNIPKEFGQFYSFLGLKKHTRHLTSLSTYFVRRLSIKYPSSDECNSFKSCKSWLNNEILNFFFWFVVLKLCKFEIVNPKFIFHGKNNFLNIKMKNIVTSLY